MRIPYSHVVVNKTTIDLQKKNLLTRDNWDGIPYPEMWLATNIPELEVSRGFYNSV